jgi:hypothetical protein
MGSDLNVMVYGGDKPHIGAVALAVPGDDENTCLLHCLPQHREGDLAKRMAVALANHFGVAVCVSCGIHLENISKDEIDAVDTIIGEFIVKCSNE